MPNPEGGPNPQENVEGQIESLLEKNLAIHDAGIPEPILEAVLATGATMALPKDGAERQAQNYEAYKAGDPQARRVNNLESVFSPKYATNLNTLLENLRQLGNDDPQAAEAFLSPSGDRPPTTEAAMYYLFKHGHLQQALEKLGPAKAERFMGMVTERSQTDFSNMETIVKMNTPEYRAREKDFTELLKEVYIALFNLGIDVAKLDE
jgi:hypothetical protein